MSITPLTLTGVSQYSTDYQNILTRAVQIAQIPVTALQNQDSDVSQKEVLLGSLNAAVAGLASSLQTLGSDAGSGALAASSSDPASVTATNTGTTTPITYTINSITSTATAASERSLTGYANSSSTPVSAAGTVQLTVGSQNYTINLGGKNNLTNLRDQINSLGAGVTASILTTGNGNYLSVAANSTGATTLKLVDDPTGAATNLLTNTNQGSDAVFSLNGITVDQPSDTVNSVISGLTFTLQKTSSTPVTISVAASGSQLSSDLSTFVSSYNALQTQLQAQVGSSAGLLSGDTAVTGLQNVMRQLTSYTKSTGSVQSLADLGITFNDATGQASFDPTVVSNMSSTQLSDAMKMIGSASSGLAGFAQSFTGYSDPVTGLIQTEVTGLKQNDTQLKDQITTLTDRINTMQTNLSKQLAAADALQAQLQSQQSAVSASIQGLNLVMYGKQTTTA